MRRTVETKEYKINLFEALENEDYAKMIKSSKAWNKMKKTRQGLWYPFCTLFQVLDKATGEVIGEEIRDIRIITDNEDDLISACSVRLECSLGCNGCAYRQTCKKWSKENGIFPFDFIRLNQRYWG